jgi:hypothetical protein
VDTKLSGNGSDFPMLGIKVTTNLGTGFRANHLDFIILTWGLWGRDRPNGPAGRSKYSKETADVGSPAVSAVPAMLGTKLPTMVLSETRGLQLCSEVRGGIGCKWRLVPKHADRLPRVLILSLDPSVSGRTRLATAKDDPQRRERTLGPRHSSCLWFQLFSVEMRSFLPDD